ncbi:MAG TPA: hypothetical protein ENJ45_00315 [Phaeodactylibacter sp.]|nr:hypothetical protein [Phaeodactylibacter sp.]
MNFRHLYFFLALFLLNTTLLNAQNYKGAIGLRLGYPVSVSGKLFIGETTALEAFVGTRGYTYFRWVNAGLAYQKYQLLEIEDLEGLSWYYGAGLNAYFWTYEDLFVGDESSLSFGVSGYIGLDYAFEDLPLNLTIDWVPTFFINSYLGGFGGRYGSLGIRYIFSRE